MDDLKSGRKTITKRHHQSSREKKELEAEEEEEENEEEEGEGEGEGEEEEEEENKEEKGEEKNPFFTKKSRKTGAVKHGEMRKNIMMSI